MDEPQRENIEMISQYLIINDSTRLVIQILEEEDIEKLSWDDAIEIVLEDGERQYILYDYPYVAIELRDFCRCLKRLLSGELELDEQVWHIGIGYYGEISHYESNNPNIPDVIPKYSALDTPVYDIGNKTWIYSISGVYYLEVTKHYKWMCEEDDLIADTDYIPFDEFMDNYPKGMKYQLAPDRVREWIDVIQSIIDFD